jgi:hypothetical protein
MSSRAAVGNQFSEEARRLAEFDWCPFKCQGVGLDLGNIHPERFPSRHEGHIRELKKAACGAFRNSKIGRPILVSLHQQQLSDLSRALFRRRLNIAWRTIASGTGRPPHRTTRASASP